MVGFTRAMNEEGVATLRFNFPYMEGEKKRAPDRPPVAIAAWRAAFESGAHRVRTVPTSRSGPAGSRSAAAWPRWRWPRACPLPAWCSWAIPCMRPASRIACATSTSTRSRCRCCSCKAHGTPSRPARCSDRSSRSSGSKADRAPDRGRRSFLRGSWREARSRRDGRVGCAHRRCIHARAWGSVTRHAPQEPSRSSVLRAHRRRLLHGPMRRSGHRRRGSTSGTSAVRRSTDAPAATTWSAPGSGTWWWCRRVTSREPPLAHGVLAFGASAGRPLSAAAFREVVGAHRYDAVMQPDATVDRRRRRASSSPDSKRLPCDLCGHPMEPEHAHYKCPACHYILPCCGW